MLVRKTRKYKGQHLNSVTTFEKIQLGGLEQTILIRSENQDKPILLFLHGGPGASQIGFAPSFQKELEKEFVVVNWDQRGAGLSYSSSLKTEDLSIETFVNDAVELIEYLLEKFNQPKLFLVGHSWGSVLGILVSQRCPHYIYSYIGIGQIANMMQGEKISYEYTLQKAKETDNQKALQELEAVEFQPTQTNYLRIQRRWLEKFGGSMVGITVPKLLFSAFFFNREYTWRDWLNAIKGGKLSLNSLWDEIMTIDFFAAVPALNVPVYFCTGRYDYQTPFQVAETYYELLQCPKKEWIWFENSAHLANFEEPEKFADVCRRIKSENS